MRLDTLLGFVDVLDGEPALEIMELMLTDSDCPSPGASVQRADPLVINQPTCSDTTSAFETEDCISVAGGILNCEMFNERHRKFTAEPDPPLAVCLTAQSEDSPCLDLSMY